MSKVLQVEIEVEEVKVQQITENQNQNFGLFSKEFAKRNQNLFNNNYFGLHLVGTTTTWFLLDIAFFSQNLFNNYLIPPAKEMNAIHEVYNIARAQTLIALSSAVPGYWFTVAFIDYMGCFAIQLMGFFFMTVFMFALAIPYDHWTKKDNRIGFVVMYSLTFFFANFGPNATTFIVPVEIFPARLRSTSHGISAAAGKAGAIMLHKVRIPRRLMLWLPDQYWDEELPHYAWCGQLLWHVIHLVSAKTKGEITRRVEWGA